MCNNESIIEITCKISYLQLHLTFHYITGYLNIIVNAGNRSLVSAAR